MQYLAVLGRQPEISLAELAALFSNVRQVSESIAFFEAEKDPDMRRLGGSLKVAKKLEGQTPEEYLRNLPRGKITLGVSDYTYYGQGYSRRDARNLTEFGNQLKEAVRAPGRSMRVLPNSSPVISTAAAHHNGLGRHPKKVELIKFLDDWYTSLGVQNIAGYARRDQLRPARDAKVGMLPPKLAQILINLCGELPPKTLILDPFCGTGVVLQEALLMGYWAYGTDKSERMIEYTAKNLEWVGEPLRVSLKKPVLQVGDATTYKWTRKPGAVVAEIYLGPPMSEIPTDIELKEANQECGSILRGFLKNLAGQLEAGVPVSLAVPAWRRPDGSFEHLPLDYVEDLGYNRLDRNTGELLYAREKQVVAREIIVLRKK